MKRRCHNKNNPSYKNYGGRGITICEDWNLDFLNFKEWADNNGYQSNLSIDRIDVNGNYEPCNCRWTTMKIQANNRRNNRRIEINGEVRNASEWSEISGVDVSTILCRIETGRYDDKDAVFEKDIRNLTHKTITADGETMGILEWSRKTGISQNTLRDRLINGWNGEDIIHTHAPAPRQIEIDGVLRSVYEWAKIVGITPKTIYDRLFNGWNEVDVVITPVGSFPKGFERSVKKYSHEEVERLTELYVRGTPIREIARILNRTDASVRKKITTLRKQHKIPETLPFD